MIMEYNLHSWADKDVAERLKGREDFRLVCRDWWWAISRSPLFTFRAVDYSRPIDTSIQLPPDTRVHIYCKTGLSGTYCHEHNPVPAEWLAQCRAAVFCGTALARGYPIADMPLLEEACVLRSKHTPWGDTLNLQLDFILGPELNRLHIGGNFHITVGAPSLRHLNLTDLTMEPGDLLHMFALVPNITSFHGASISTRSPDDWDPQLVELEDEAPTDLLIGIEEVDLDNVDFPVLYSLLKAIPNSRVVRRFVVRARWGGAETPQNGGPTTYGRLLSMLSRHGAIGRLVDDFEFTIGQGGLLLRGKGLKVTLVYGSAGRLATALQLPDGTDVQWSERFHEIPGMLAFSLAEGSVAAATANDGAAFVTRLPRGIADVVCEGGRLGYAAEMEVLNALIADSQLWPGLKTFWVLDRLDSYREPQLAAFGTACRSLRMGRTEVDGGLTGTQTAHLVAQGH